MLLPSHHIFCGGDYCVPFARLAAHCLNYYCPVELRPMLRIYIHVDGLTKLNDSKVCAWFSELPQTWVINRAFGIKNPKKIPGHWHQIMVNMTAQRFSVEDNITIVDADFFLTSSRWFSIAEGIQQDDFSLSYELRTDRTVELNNQQFHGIRTHFFTIKPTLHSSINTQRFTKDEKALSSFQARYPHVEFYMRKALDSMVISSLEAQLLGYAVHDIKDKMDGLHIGGVSHINTKKLANTLEPSMRHAWLERLLLHRATLALFDQLGWDNFVDPLYRRRIADFDARIEKLGLAKELDQIASQSADLERLSNLGQIIIQDPYDSNLSC